MFIATSARPKISLRRSETWQQPSPGRAKADCAPTELRSKDKGPRGYKHLAPLGRSDNNVVLHLQLEVAQPEFA